MPFIHLLLQHTIPLPRNPQPEVAAQGKEKNGRGTSLPGQTSVGSLSGTFSFTGVGVAVWTVLLNVVDGTGFWVVPGLERSFSKFASKAFCSVTTKE